MNKHNVFSVGINNTIHYDLYTHRDKEKLKQRDEAWNKIQNLAQDNPQVSMSSFIISLGSCSCRDEHIGLASVW